MHCTHHSALTPPEFEHLMHILIGLSHSRYDWDHVTTVFNTKFGFTKRSKGEIICAIQAWSKEREEISKEQSRASEASEQEGPNDG